MTEFFDYRVRFKKLGNARFISHLDLTRCLQRALKRSQLPVWHTEGFNPHPYVSLPLPLPLGQASEGEILDFRLTERVSCGEILKRLSDVLPDDIIPYSVFMPFNKVKFIERASYKIVFPGCSQTADEVSDFLCQRPLIIEKTTKSKKTVEIDLSQHLINCEIKKFSNGDLIIEVILPAGSSLNINPTLLTDLINQKVLNNDSPALITRTAILNSKNELFD